MIDPPGWCKKGGLRKQALDLTYFYFIDNFIMKFKSLDIFIQIQIYPEIAKDNLGKFMQMIKILTLDFPLV